MSKSKFVPTMYNDLGEMIRFLNNTDSILVPRSDHHLLSQIFGNMETLPELPEDLDSAIRSLLVPSEDDENESKPEDEDDEDGDDEESAEEDTGGEPAPAVVAKKKARVAKK